MINIEEMGESTLEEEIRGVDKGQKIEEDNSSTEEKTRVGD